MLVSFVRYDRTIRGTTPATVPSYAAFAIRPGAARVAFVPLGPATTIEQVVMAWRKAAIGEGAVLTPRGRAESQYAAAADRLRAAVWDPVEPEIGAARRVFVVPDGMLNLVTIAALTDRQGRYQIERDAVIHYLSTERDLVLLGGTSMSRGSLLAIGNPAFDNGVPSRSQPARLGSEPRNAKEAAQGTDCAAPGPPRFGNLPGSLSEVTDISRIWPSSGSSLVTVLSGPNASETTVKKAIAGRRVIHFATHGFFIGEECPPAMGTRGSSPPASSRAVRVAEEGRENPLLMSGLALAGANRRSAARLDQDDGILTAEEVATLNLTGVEWAVLSACDTGVGEIRAGEGVFGLRRAFQVASARTVIMSLWSVDDQATRAWMRALYDARYQKRLSTADAVHAASISVLTDRRAKGQSTLPFYWAAFVAAGDWK